ncbi:glutamate ABC transporter substrate-binding protein [soil metagenome]
MTRSTRLRVPSLMAAGILAVALAGCGGYADTVVAPPAPAPSTSAPPAPECTDSGNPLRSYEPTGDALSSPEVQKIRDRGRLIVGVAADTKLLASRNPANNKIEGFDIDMANAVAEKIFGEPGHVDLKVITAAERIPKLQDGTVDIVARNMTVNCIRWQSIAFSEIYYDAGQKVLVGTDSGINSLEDLDGKRICAPAGTTSIANIQTIAPKAIPVTAGDNSACMVLFQNGEADGVSTDDTVLAGLAVQDPYAKVLDTKFLTQEPYGIGVGSDNTDLVRVVNQTLEDMRRDGRWQASYDFWLKAALEGVPGKQPKPVYGR